VLSHAGRAWLSRMARLRAGPQRSGPLRYGQCPRGHAFVIARFVQVTAAVRLGHSRASPVSDQAARAPGI
jgi:hypothetical protein